MIKKTLAGGVLIILWTAFILVAILGVKGFELNSPFDPFFLVLLVILMMVSIGLTIEITNKLIKVIVKDTKYEKKWEIFDELIKDSIYKRFEIVYSENTPPMREIASLKLLEFSNTAYTRIEFSDRSSEWYNGWNTAEKLQNWNQITDYRDVKQLEDEYKKYLLKEDSCNELKNISKSQV